MELFKQLKNNLLYLDPVAFCEAKIILEGSKFRLTGNGYKPFADIYRYIGIKALERDSKPVVLVKGRQVGATVMAGSLEMYFMTSGLFGTGGRPPMRIMHCFPQLDLAYGYTKEKLDPIMSAGVPPDIISAKMIGKRKSYFESMLDTGSATNNSLQFKKFINNNHLLVESTGLAADRIRGHTLDAMFFDEVQDMTRNALINATKSLTKARYGPPRVGLQIYFGTPKQRGTAYWDMWQASSQMYFHLGCERCGQHFPLYTPGSDDWERIWKEGYLVECTKCNKLQNKNDAAERGKWIPFGDKGDKAEFIGYHINQLYIPDFERETIIKAKPENSAITTERGYQNEILGEFYDGSGAPITAEEIREKCADFDRKFMAGIPYASGKRVYLGCDWGDKVDVDQLAVGEGGAQRGQSYSCVVVLIADGPQRLSVVFATRLKRNDVDYKKAIVEQMFRQYSITQAVGDVGYAHDLTYMLQQEYNDRFLASRAHPKIVKHGHIKFVKDVFPREIQFEKNYYITELYDLMKRGSIRFPYGDFEKIAWLVQHCCSMDIKVTMDRSGDGIMNYVKGSTPNDGFMALLNAYIAYKYDLTKGFTLYDPNSFNAEALEKRESEPMAISAYLPKMRTFGM